jgi:hypothetical protein
MRRLFVVMVGLLLLVGCGKNNGNGNSNPGPAPVNADKKPKPGWTSDMEGQWNTLCKLQFGSTPLSDDQVKGLCGCILSQLELDYTPQQIQSVGQSGMPALKQNLASYGTACAKKAGLPPSVLPPLGF